MDIATLTQLISVGKDFLGGGDSEDGGLPKAKEYRPDFDRHQILYTFTKDKNIVTCLVHLDHFRGEPSYNHRCFNITGLDRD